ncbi:uncharacterized protein [Epargyreus clarus]|uniref:uncharacterized protein n=1 Tax=Epargyreus clarus TaxID=520877 RepID=UPI003C2CC182
MAYYEDIVDIGGQAKCILCEVYLPDDNNYVDTHINGDQHMGLYVKRIMINNNLVLQHSKPYCLICNSVVCNLEDHIQSNQHQQRMDEIKYMVEKDGAFLEIPTKIAHKESEVHCTICDCTVGFEIKEIKDHIQSVKHKRARAMAVQPSNGIFSVEGTDDDLFCKICQLYFENYIECIFEHVDEDEKHTQTLNKILRLIKGQNITIEKYLTNVAEDKATCNKCSIEVPCNIDNLERHVKGKKHKNA